MEYDLKKLGKGRIAVIGDFCLDVYWHADMTKSELSRETPHFPLPIVQERMSPGGAGNVVANLLALKPKKVHAIGVFGADWRGTALKDLLKKGGADISGVVTDPGRVTNTYIKPLRKGYAENVVYEDPRLDFTNYEPLAAATEKKLLELLDKVAKKIDVLCVCDQMPFGCITEAVRDRICELGEAGLEDRRGQRTAQQEPRTEEERLRIEVAQLKHELYMTKMERDLLKKLEEIERREAYRK
jgi:bifunctional ADP-heptose synthase (sugar kinase/adenylyltransferase)